MTSAWNRFQPFVTVVPRYLALALTGDEQMALEDALFDRFGVTSLLDWEGPSAGLLDLVKAAPLETLAPELVGRTPLRLATVEGLIPFDWDVDGSVKMNDIEHAMQTLPGLVPGPGPLVYFGSSVSAPPCLWTSFEAPGLQLGGVVAEADWAAWTAAFGDRLERFALRRR